MPATPDPHALQAGTRRIERLLQQLFDEATQAGRGAATLSFEWKGGQGGGDIPVAEAVALEALSPQGDGRLVMRHQEVADCADGVSPRVREELEALARRMAGGGAEGRPRSVDRP